MDDDDNVQDDKGNDNDKDLDVRMVPIIKFCKENLFQTIKSDINCGFTKIT